MEPINALHLQWHRKIKNYWQVIAAARAFTAGSHRGLPHYIGCAVINTTSNLSPSCFYTRETLLLAQETATGNLGQSLPLVVKALKP